MIESVGGGAAGSPRRTGDVTGAGKDESAERANGDDPVSGPQNTVERDSIGRRVRMVKELRDVRPERVHEVTSRLREGKLDGREILKRTAQKMLEKEL